ncbi:MAG: hypothetical protein V1899_04585 [Planctomycetota bacterium]
MAAVSAGGFTDKIAAGSPATRSLQTIGFSSSGMANFNSDNLPKMQAYVNIDGTVPKYIATSSDADVNGDEKISLPTSWEKAGAATVIIGTTVPLLSSVAAGIVLNLHPDIGPPYASPSECDKGVLWGGTFIDWAIVGSIGSRVAYQALRDISSVTIQETTANVYVVENPRSPQNRQKNDFLVTRESAECQIFGSPFSTLIYFSGKMHGDICDNQVGSQLVVRGDVFISRK